MANTPSCGELTTNALGRAVPGVVNGRKQVPFQGVYRHRAQGRKAAPPIRSAADYPADGDKRVGSLSEALEACGIQDGMTLSTHHHFRNGDFVSNMLFDACAKLGRRDLTWFPSASFPCHAAMIAHMDAGVVHHVEGSLNGPLGDYCTAGRMRGLGVLRSHGGRWQAIQDGESHIDIAVIAAPCADPFGNANGVHGPAACGSLYFALADSLYADRVIVVTDHLVPFPAIPWQIQGNNVDFVVCVDRIGDPSRIVSGTTAVTKSPDRLLVAEWTARFVRGSCARDSRFKRARAGRRWPSRSTSRR
jgi:citrate lyase subunit alpha / citrate CoA-transferase